MSLPGISEGCRAPDASLSPSGFLLVQILNAIPLHMYTFAARTCIPLSVSNPRIENCEFRTARLFMTTCICCILALDVPGVRLQVPDSSFAIRAIGASVLGHSPRGFSPSSLADLDCETVRLGMLSTARMGLYCNRLRSIWRLASITGFDLAAEKRALTTSWALKSRVKVIPSRARRVLGSLLLGLHTRRWLYI